MSKHKLKSRLQPPKTIGTCALCHEPVSSWSKAHYIRWVVDGPLAMAHDTCIQLFQKGVEAAEAAETQGTGSD